MVALRPSSAKAKGRRLQQQVRDLIQKTFNLPAEDVRSTGMGQSGSDIQLSARARKAFPFSVECKNTERLQVWESWDQAVAHSGEDNLEPLLVFKRNRSETLACIRLDTLVALLKEKKR